MTAPDFGKYSLALIRDGEIIFSSEKSGIRPLVECAERFMGKLAGCELHDKVIGLAAARIIAYSGIASNIIAGTASKHAVELLEQEGISTRAGDIVEGILNKDRTAPCPMEKRALLHDDNGAFFIEVKKILFR
jgi:hypothetical protein